MGAWLKYYDKRVCNHVKKLLLELELQTLYNKKTLDKEMTFMEKLYLDDDISRVQQRMMLCEQSIANIDLHSEKILADVKHSHLMERRMAEYQIKETVHKLFKL
jgi:hypothetical protein